MADGMIPPPPLRRPAGPAPAANAPQAEREAWSYGFVEWFLSISTGTEGELPEDVRPDHRWRVEYNACVMDPAKYEKDVDFELSQ